MKQMGVHRFALMISILFLAALILAVPAVFGGGLGFKDIETEIKGDFATGVSASGGSFEAAPEDYIVFSVKVENTFPVDTDGHKIRSVDVRLRIDPLCSDDLDNQTEQTVSLQDLEPDSSDTATFRYQVPDCADQDNYDVEIRVKGKDKTDSTQYTIQETLRMTINKDASAITFDFSKPNPQTISCDKRSFTVSVETHNIGSITFDSGILVINNDLGINKWDFITLHPGRWTEDNTMFAKNYTFTIPKTVAPGDYDLRAEVEYEDGVKSEKRFQTLTVPDCSASQETTSSETAAQETTSAGSTSSIPAASLTSVPVIAPATTKEPTAESNTASVEPSTQNSGQGADYTVPLLIGGLIVGLLVLGGMLAFLLKKK